MRDMITERNEFDEIRPYEAGEMKQAFEDLLNDRQFNVVMKGFAPWLPKSLRNGLLRLAFTGIKTPLDFQKRFMKPVVKWIMRRHTDGCSFDDSSLSRNEERGASKENSSDDEKSNLVPRSSFLVPRSTLRLIDAANGLQGEGVAL